MLVLSRKLGEKIFIGENICITVVDVDRGKIRLGIDAPRDVPIFRKELLPPDGASAEPMKSHASASLQEPEHIRQPLDSRHAEGRRLSVWVEEQGLQSGPAGTLIVVRHVVADIQSLAFRTATLPAGRSKELLGRLP